MRGAPRTPTTARGAGRKRAYKPAAERRAEIMAATIAILAERGLGEWKTAELARRVGISEAALFRHFRNKNEILDAAVRQETRALRRLLREQPTAGSPWERAAGLVRSILEFFERTGGGPLVVFTGQGLRASASLRADVLRTVGLVRERLEALYAGALQPRKGAGETAGILADLSIAVIQSCGLRWIVTEHRFPMHQTAAAMLRLLRRIDAPSEGRDP